MKKLLSILFLITGMTLRAAVPPPYVPNAYDTNSTATIDARLSGMFIRSAAGVGTNTTLKTPTMFSVHFTPTNHTLVAAGTVSGTSGTHVLTFSGTNTAGMHPADAIAIGAHQYNIVRVIDATSVYVNAINGSTLVATYSGAAYSFYPASAYFRDVNGNYFGGILADGGTLMIGLGASGGNSAEATYQTSDGDGYGISTPGDGSFNISDKKGAGWGAPFIIEAGTQARYNALWTRSNGVVELFWRALRIGNGNESYILTNSGPTNLSIRPNMAAPGVGLNLGPGGFLGIGTATPTNALTVVGTEVVVAPAGSTAMEISSGNTVSSDGLLITSSQGSSARRMRIVPSGNSSVAFRMESGGGFNFMDSSSVSLWSSSGSGSTVSWTTPGLIGIGTTSPAEKLNVMGNGAFSGTNYITNGLSVGPYQAVAGAENLMAHIVTNVYYWQTNVDIPQVNAEAVAYTRIEVPFARTNLCTVTMTVPPSYVTGSASSAGWCHSWVFPSNNCIFIVTDNPQSTGNFDPPQGVYGFKIELWGNP